MLLCRPAPMSLAFFGAETGTNAASGSTTVATTTTTVDENATTAEGWDLG